MVPVTTPMLSAYPAPGDSFAISTPLRYIDFTADLSAPVEVSSEQKSQPSSGYTEHTQKNPKKHSSSFVFWSEDRHDLTSVLDHFPGTNQRDRISAWIAWSISQLKL